MPVTRIDIESRGRLCTGAGVRRGRRLRVPHGHAALHGRPEAPRPRRDLRPRPGADECARTWSSTARSFTCSSRSQPKPGGRLLVDSINRGNMTALSMFCSAERRIGRHARREHGQRLPDARGLQRARGGHPVGPAGVAGAHAGLVPRGDGERAAADRAVVHPVVAQPRDAAPAAVGRRAQALPHGERQRPRRGADGARPPGRRRRARSRATSGASVALVDGNVVESAEHVWLEGGFQPGYVYEITYTAIGAPVIGLGFLAYRDAASFFKYATLSEGNPLAARLSTPTPGARA